MKEDEKVYNFRKKKKMENLVDFQRIGPLEGPSEKHLWWKKFTRVSVLDWHGYRHNSRVAMGEWDMIKNTNADDYNKILYGGWLVKIDKAAFKYLPDISFSYSDVELCISMHLK